MEFATRTIHAAQPSEPGTGALVAPIFQTSTFEQEAPGVNQGFDYSRTNNPTRARLEAVLADSRASGTRRSSPQDWPRSTPFFRPGSSPETKSSCPSTSTAAPTGC